eukprot:CAMPEP_0201126366 /NCGR_PEP_ID=MMETSP0850-20130426/25820_1 /ASSEMBLY_ACC=CAM_ASM_000622 /TAXON_ID=183588 /ORGANISM="Pseudo-nitzschia fraudulenta, Strain WWA7" /LENGTH=94 /DNA_ID=CAMNT_0047394773 /DNA_START=24 /DNA_END=305 /DNA_ORIENTATION=+
MAAVAKIHAARQPPIPLKPFIEYHHYATTRVTTQFETPTGNSTATKTATCKQDFPFAPDASDNENASSALSTTSKKHASNPNVSTSKMKPCTKR